MNQDENMKDTKYEEALDRARKGMSIDEIFPEMKESEDERIRKELWEYFHNIQLKCDGDFSPSFTIDDILAYLERQKEQEPILIPKFKVGDRIYDKRDSYNRNVIREVGKDYYINAFAQKMDMAYTDANFEFLEHLDNDLIFDKSAEWGEEDEKMLEAFLHKLEVCDLLSNKEVKWAKLRLKSLRPQPQWKPSEEQMKALHKAAEKDFFGVDGATLRILNADLKKLL